MLARREAAKVIRFHPIAMRFQEVVTAVVRHANIGLMAVSVANHEGLGAGIDRRDSHGFGVMLLRAGDAVDAAHYRDAPVWSAPNTIQIDHFDISVFCLTDDIR
jgi:hypothetical protein